MKNNLLPHREWLGATQSSLSRRDFLRVSAVAAAGLVALGKVPSGLAQASSLEQLFEEFDQMAEQAIATYGVPGMSVGLIHDGTPIYGKGFGVMRVGTNRPVTVQSVEPICSMSKAFAAVAIMQLVETGKIDIEASLVEYVKYFKMQDSQYKDVKIKHLLAHNSGLPELMSPDWWGEWIFPQYDDGAVERYVRSLAKRNYTFSSYPGDPTNFRYSDLGYDILADVIQEVSGELFAGYCRNHIIKPMHMVHSSFLKPDIPPGLLEAVHVRDENWDVVVSPIYPYNRTHGPSSGHFTNIVDLCKWAQMHLNGGEFHGQRILSTESHALLWKPLFDFGDGWGYGWGWYSGPYMDHRVILHGGAQPGISTFIILVPDMSIGMMAMGNYNNGTESDYVADYVVWAITRLIEMGV